MTEKIENPYIQLIMDDNGTCNVRVDPSGKRNYQWIGINRIQPRGINSHSKARFLRVEPFRIRVEDISIKMEFPVLKGTDQPIYEGVPIYAWPDKAWKIPHKNRFSQTFMATHTFSRAGVYIYAAGSPKECRYRVTLRKDGPDGEVLSSRSEQGDQAFGYPTIWSFLDTEPLDPGIYCLEVSETEGDIRWWRTVSRIYREGCAFMNGKPEDHLDFIFLYGYKDSINIPLSWEISIHDSEINLSILDEHNDYPEQINQHIGFELLSPWCRDGYDVTDIETAPFSAFLTDRWQYVPIEQFKRFHVAWPAYQNPTNRAAFEMTSWIHAVGRNGVDLTISKYRDIAPWPLDEDLMKWSFLGKTLCIKISQNGSKLPLQLPSFESTENEFIKLQNSFFYERSLGLSDGGAGGEWIRWIAPQSCWIGPPRSECLRKRLLEQTIDEDGYVWVMRYDGGYPHGLRYGMPPRARRHYGANPALIIGTYLYFCWTRDKEFLDIMMPRLRRAYQFMVKSNDMVWQDDLFVIIEPHHDGTGMGMPSTDLDCLPFGYKCALTNAHIYEALKCLIELEIQCEEHFRAEEVRKYHSSLRRSYNCHFWDEICGRYIGCIDIRGVKHDFGFVLLNLIAMQAGLADEKQVSRIYHWMENDPTANGVSDTYFFQIAPRANTQDIRNWWYLGGDKEWPGDISFGLGFQNGGAFLFSSYFDLLTRLRFLGPDNAFLRYKEILKRYALPDRLCGGNPLYLGEIDGYQIGASVVFPEAGLVPCVVLHGFLGVKADTQGLHICPRLPGNLPDLGINGIVFCGNILSIKAKIIEHGHEVYISMIKENPDHPLYCEGKLLIKKNTPLIRSLGRGESLRLYVTE